MDNNCYIVIRIFLQLQDSIFFIWMQNRKKTKTKNKNRTKQKDRKQAKEGKIHCKTVLMECEKEKSDVKNTVIQLQTKQIKQDYSIIF